MGHLVPTLPRPMVRTAIRHAACTQCGAPDQTGAHVCAYCLSPRQGAPMPEMIEITTISDTQRRYVTNMQDEVFRI